MYIYEQPTWPCFTWNLEALNTELLLLKSKQGELFGRLISLGFDTQQAKILDTLTIEAIKTSEIEGVIFNPEEVRSSVAKRLGLSLQNTKINTGRDVDGLVQILFEATDLNKKLTDKILFSWHELLFSNKPKDLIIGGFRDDSHGPMQVVSGPIGKQKIHFEAVPADKINNEINIFLDWLNLESETDAVIKAGVAHLWFLTIHPFEDGNGRIARAISEMALSKSENSAKRYYSLSAQIKSDRSNYYSMLEITQKGSLDITIWLQWFISSVKQAISSSIEELHTVLEKTFFWQKYSSFNFNGRQKLILSMVLEHFEEKLTTSKWSKITKCSGDTALRDIRELIELGILEKDHKAGGGRNISYNLKN